MIKENPRSTKEMSTEDALFAAIQSADATLVEEMIEQNPKLILAKDEKGRTPVEAIDSTL